MAFNLQGGYGAGAGADMLETVLRRKLLEQQETSRIAQDAERNRVMDTRYQGDQDIQRGELKLREQEYQDRKNAPAPVEKPISLAKNARLIDPTTGKVVVDAMPDAPEAAAPPMPIMRVNPRTGKVEQIGDAPKGAHFVNEPAPPSQGPTHARFNITQGADANGKPAMIRTNVDTGQVEVLPMPDGVNFAKRDQPATEAQSNSSAYAERIAQSEPILGQLEHGIAGMNPLMFKAQEMADNPYLQSKEMQQYSQAARQFVNSTLRRESGAAISPSEFDSARKQYLPMPGDSPEVLKQKSAARTIVLQGMQRGAGPAYRPAGGAGPVPPQSAGHAADPLGIR